MLEATDADICSLAHISRRPKILWNKPAACVSAQKSSAISRTMLSTGL